jgi:hypothetical protein
LHLEEGARVSRLGPHAARQNSEGTLVTCRHFTTEKLRVDGRVSRAAAMIVVLDGALEIDGRAAKPGEVWHTDTGEIGLQGQATLLLTS